MTPLAKTGHGAKKKIQNVYQILMNNFAYYKKFKKTMLKSSKWQKSAKSGIFLHFLHKTPIQRPFYSECYLTGFWILFLLQMLCMSLVSCVSDMQIVSMYIFYVNYKSSITIIVHALTFYEKDSSMNALPRYCRLMKLKTKKSNKSKYLCQL